MISGAMYLGDLNETQLETSIVYQTTCLIFLPNREVHFFAMMSYVVEAIVMKLYIFLYDRQNIASLCQIIIEGSLSS